MALAADRGLASFCEAVGARLREGGPGALQDLATPFGAFAAGPAVVAHVNRQLDAIANATGDARGEVRHWQLADSPDFTLTMFAQELAGHEILRSLESWPGDRLLACAWPDSTEIFAYENAGCSGEVFDPAARLTSRGRVRLTRGEARLVRAYDDVIDVFVPGARGVVLELAPAPRGRVVWTYDPTTLAAVAPVAADKEDAKLEYIAWTLAALADPIDGDRTSAEAIAALIDHPAHFVRWTAVRAAMELDEASGIALLARAADDPHVHVRNAARRALAQLSAAKSSHGADP